MKRNDIIYIPSLLLALVAGGCAAEIPGEEPLPSVETEEGIIIAGGKPSSDSLTTRADNEPSRPGFCNADAMRIWIYRADKGTLPFPSLNGTTPVKWQDIKVFHYSGENNCDKTTYYHYSGAPRVNSQTYFRCAAPALAYTQADVSSFTVSESATYGNLQVALTPQSSGGEYSVPELYFGNLVFNSSDATAKPDTDGSFTLQDASWTNDKFADCALRGTLYRIVSQFNVNVTEVNEEAVRKIEMYVMNLPTSIKLYGSHGTYYPVEAAKDDGQHTAKSVRDADDMLTEEAVQAAYHLVATTEDFKDGKASISTFMLPSDQWQKIGLRLYTVESTYTDEAGETVEVLTSRFFELEPPRTVLLTGEDVKVYDPAATALTIYNADDQTFHSYSNVRVNISGKFEDVFAERQTVDINVEVCPSFEDVHNDFEINY